jgi:hypothetical protein
VVFQGRHGEGTPEEASHAQLNGSTVSSRGWEPKSVAIPLVLGRARRENLAVAESAKERRADLIHERPREDWHQLLDELTKVRVGDDVTIELLDAEFGDAFEAERMPLAYIEYDEHADEASVAVGGRDGRYPVVLRHSIEHPTSILTDSKPPRLPLVIQIVGADGSETLVSVIPRS